VTTNASKSTAAGKSIARAPAARATARRATATAARAKSTATAGRAASRRARPSAPPAEQTSQWGFPIAHAVLAAERTIQRNSVQVALPLIGVLHLPSKDDLVFMGGVAGLAALGIIEWPVAITLGIGHALAANRHNRLVREFGNALEEA
jgi:hypothetical protein